MNMSETSKPPTAEARAAVAVYLKNYKSGDGPFAMSEAMASVRQSFPNLSDNELTAAIADAAVEAGLDIHVHDADPPPSTRRMERWEDEGGSSGQDGR